MKTSQNKTGFRPASKVTKTVRLINKEGVGAEIDFGYSVRQFKCKNGCEHHNHMVCSVCGKFIYIDDLNLEEYQDKLAIMNGFKPQKQVFRIYGICSNCQ